MDIQAANEEMRKTLTELIRLFSGIENSKINTIPFADSWTAGQLSQHVILSAGGMVQMITGPVVDTQRNPEENIPQLKAAFLDFTTKMKSPDFIVPKLEDYNKADLTHSLEQIKDQLLYAIQTLDLSKTCTLFELPNMGHITRAEAVAFTIVHTQRHIHQLKNIIKHL